MTPAPPSGGGLRAWLAAPVSGVSCALSWCAATTLFLLLVASCGGFTQTDSYESVFSTWAIAHGMTTCAFPHGFNVTAPLYPLLSGGVVALAHIGHGVPFPPRAALGGRCDQAFDAIDTWSMQTGATERTLQIGLLGWVALLAGSVAVLRAAGRGRRRWEPVTVVVLACLPPVWTCVQSTFHPEDLLALGLALGAVACGLRGSWGLAGVLAGLAVLSQQFAALVAVPLFFVAPPARRAGYGAGAAVAVAAVGVPLIAVTSGAATRALFLGTGDSSGIGGALVSELHLHGAPLVLLSRICPLVLSALAAFAIVRRLGQQARTPVVTLSLVAFSLGLRLVFEQQVFEYYFMALTVALLLLDVARGRIRASLVAWMLTVAVVYVGEIDRVDYDPDMVRIAVIALAVAFIAPVAGRAGTTWRRAAPWLAAIACTLLAWPNVGLGAELPMWFWQIVLVAWALVLATAPAVRALADDRPATDTAASLRRPATPRFANPAFMPNASRGPELS